MSKPADLRHWATELGKLAKTGDAWSMSAEALGRLAKLLDEAAGDLAEYDRLIDQMAVDSGWDLADWQAAKKAIEDGKFNPN